jgi:hypothetical protein
MEKLTFWSFNGIILPCTSVNLNLNVLNVCLLQSRTSNGKALTSLLVNPNLAETAIFLITVNSPGLGPNVE